MTGRFSGQVALVTGAGQGIGRASALRLARDGAHVVINDLSADTASVTQKMVTAAGGSGTVLVGDVTVEGCVDEVFAAILDRHGRIDIVHNNVGFGGRKSIVDTTDQSWAHGIDGNLGATFRGIRAAIRAMAPRRGGVVVNTASAAGVRAVRGVIPYYGAAKAAVIQLTRMAAVEAGEFGIRVNAVVPGSVRTPSFEHYLGTEKLAAYIQQIPLRRIAEPEDIANAVAFLASAEAAAITGVALPVDAGAGAILWEPAV